MIQPRILLVAVVVNRVIKQYTSKPYDRIWCWGV